MPDPSTGRSDKRAWLRMHEEWLETNMLARQAQLWVWCKLAEQAGGIGDGPTALDLQQAEGLQRGADMQLLAISAFLHDALR